MKCQQCNNPMGTHYQLNHIDATGTTKSTVSVCSLICVVRFAYAYGAQRSAVGAMMLKHTVTQALSALRGSPRR